jgi:hypothetical protein
MLAAVASGGVRVLTVVFYERVEGDGLIRLVPEHPLIHCLQLT